MKPGTFTLHKQFPKTKTICDGVLNISNDGTAHFFDVAGVVLLEKMIRVKIEFAGLAGIMLSGFERSGLNKKGSDVYAYQEWFLQYKEELK